MSSHDAEIYELVLGTRIGAVSRRGKAMVHEGKAASF